MRAIALEGLQYAQNPYDVDRYNKLLTLASNHYSEILKIDSFSILEKLQSQIGITTPKIGAEAIVLNDNGQILILKRSDDETWCFPCGWVDVQESPAQAAVREVYEETGLSLLADAYISISCKGPRLDSNIQHQMNIATLMKSAPSACNIALSHEHTEYMWIEPTARDVIWHPGHEEQFGRLCTYLQSDRKQALAI
jgi:8-oxo-dGTP pyrophosphatase MutT (NUDIX family)